MDLPLSQYWWLYLTRGILAILLGITVLLLPGVTFTFLVIFWGAYMLADGLFASVAAITDRHNRKGRGWFLASGIISLLVGILVLLNPFAWAIALVYIVAFWALLAGIIEIIAAIRLRKVIKGEGWYILVGVLTLLFGVSLLFSPLAGVVTLAFVFAFYSLINGSLLISLGLRLRRRNSKSTGGHRVEIV